LPVRWAQKATTAGSNGVALPCAATAPVMLPRLTVTVTGTVTLTVPSAPATACGVGGTDRVVGRPRPSLLLHVELELARRDGEVVFLVDAGKMQADDLPGEH